MVSDPLTVSKLWSRRKNGTPTARSMLLACPNCATTYEVNAAVVGDGGRSLRCVRCQVVWYATRAQALVVAAQPADAVGPAQASPPAADSVPAASTPENGASDPPAASAEHAAPNQAIPAEIGRAHV